jgi:flagellar hook assembly protein FlgD
MLPARFIQSAGNLKAVNWDGKDSFGNAVQPGLYTCKVLVQGKEASVVVRKM